MSATTGRKGFVWSCVLAILSVGPPFQGPAPGCYAGLGVRHMMRPSYIDDELAVADDAGEVTVVRELDRLPSVHLFSVLYICCCVHPT